MTSICFVFALFVQARVAIATQLPQRTLQLGALIWVAVSQTPGIAHAGDVLTFLQSSDLVQPAGVNLKVQPVTTGLTLYQRERGGSVYQTPMASRVWDDGAVQIWYLRVDYSQKDLSDQLVLCLGELRNGNWTLPSHGKNELPWGGPNNVVMKRSPHRSTWGGFNPFQIVVGTDGLEMLYWDQPGPTGKAGGLRASSRDGLVWDKQPGAVFTDFNDAFTLMRVKGEDRLYQTGLCPWPEKPYPDSLAAYRRVICLRTSRDQFATWTPMQLEKPMLEPDDRDSRETEFYCFKAFPVGDRFAGILWKYYADPARPNQHSQKFRYELVVSDDGRKWERPFRDTDLGFWTYADPFVLDGHLWFVTQGAPGNEDSGSTMLKGWQADRMVAVEGSGSFRMQPFPRPKGELILDANVGAGSILVTPCDGEGNSIPGLNPYRATGENSRHALPWSEAKLPETLSLAISMESAKVYGVSSNSH